MRMEDIEVYAGEKGDVVLKQRGGADEDAVIFLAPEQVEIVCRWMRRTAIELFGPDAMEKSK